VSGQFIFAVGSGPPRHCCGGPRQKAGRYSEPGHREGSADASRGQAGTVPARPTGKAQQACDLLGQAPGRPAP